MRLTSSSRHLVRRHHQPHDQRHARVRDVGEWPPDGPAIDEVAHELILSAIGPVGARHRGADIEMAATIIDEVMQEICDGIFAVSDELLEAAEE